MHNSTVVGLFIAKFHYTGPTGPDQTKSADFVADPRGPALTLSETRVCGPGLAKKSVRVRARCGLMWARETTGPRQRKGHFGNMSRPIIEIVYSEL